jgi:hypothetical protein
MESAVGLHESWTVLETMFPHNWRELAKETNALVRKLRSFADEECVMRTLLLHVANGYSLRETVTRAKESGLANVTDVALLKRLQCSEEWFKALCICLLKERGVITNTAITNDIQMRIVDGTKVKEPGKTGSEWRIHYSLKLPDLYCDYFKLTASKGILTGESFKQFPVKKGECIIGDRGYSTAQGIAYLAEREAYSLVRVNTSAFQFYVTDDDGNESNFNLLANVATAQEEAAKEWKVHIKEKNYGVIEGRLCVIRKSETAIKQALKKLKRDASKRQSVLKPETIEFAKYVILFTTLPHNKFTVAEIFKWYRLRWQVELIFKRLKSLAGFGHLPKYDDVSARAWLYGKLFVGLLTEKLIHSARVISPWGYCLSWENQEQLERV